MTYSELIRFFQTTEEPGQIIPLVQSQRLQWLVSIWGNIPIAQPSKKQLNTKCPHELRAEQLRWMWSLVVVPLNDVVKSVRGPSVSIPHLVEQAKMAQLIYPNGDVHRAAKQYLHAMIARKLARKAATTKKELSDGLHP